MDAIFYAQNPQHVDDPAFACIEVLSPGVVAASVSPKDYVCQALSPTASGVGTTPGSEFGTGDKRGVDTSQIMRAEICCAGDDFDIPSQSQTLQLNPGEHKVFRFVVIPKRTGHYTLVARLFTTSPDGKADTEVYQGAAQVRVTIGPNLWQKARDWALENWQLLAALGAGLGGAVGFLLNHLRKSPKSKRASPVRRKRSADDDG